MTGCLHMWKNIFGGKSVNHKKISTLLSLPLYIIWARMNIQQQLIMYHTDGKSMWTVLVIPPRRVHVCKRSGISVVLLSCILYYNKIIRRNSEMAHICMYVRMCMCVCVCLCMCICICVCTYVRMYVRWTTWKFFWSSVITPVSKSQKGTDVKVYFLWPTKGKYSNYCYTM